MASQIGQVRSSLHYHTELKSFKPTLSPPTETPTNDELIDRQNGDPTYSSHNAEYNVNLIKATKLQPNEGWYKMFEGERALTPTHTRYPMDNDAVFVAIETPGSDVFRRRKSSYPSLDFVSCTKSPVGDKEKHLLSTSAYSERSNQRRKSKQSDTGIESITSYRHYSFTRSMTRQSSVTSKDNKEQCDGSSGIESSDSEAYDTDLDDPPGDEVRPEAYKGIRCYEYQCAELKVAPQRAIIAGLDSSHLSLRHRNMGPSNIRPLAMALVQNSRVSYLDLHDTGLGSVGAAHIAEMCLENDFLYGLDISNNRIGVAGGRAMGEVIRHNRNLININLANNVLMDAGLEQISFALRGNDRIIELNLSGNEIENGGVQLAKALSSNDCLEKLDLSWNKIGPRGFVHLLRGLHSNTSLTDLDVSYNAIAYEGSLAMAKFLKVNKTLKVLDVSNARITWHGAIMVADGLKKNSTLEALKMGGNPLTTTGCQDIMEAASDASCQLQFLSLKGVPVVGEFEMLARAVQQSRTFDFEHGGIVNTHDMLGQRHGRVIDPMQKIIGYMKERGLRPTELFREFDKSVSNKLEADTFAQRLDIAGVSLPKHELVRIMEQIIPGTSSADKSMDFKKMAHVIRDHEERERMRVIKERERARTVREHHRKILASGDELMKNVTQDEVAELFDDTRSLRSIISELRALHGGRNSSQGNPTSSRLPRINSAGSVIAGQPNVLKNAPTSRTTNNKHKSPRVLSMATQLGGKAKAFGTAAVEKKKKRKKKRKRKY